MSSPFIATIIAAYWFIFTLVLVMALADNLPAEFMQQNYTGPITKPRPAAQIAFLTITGTIFAAFLTWVVTSRISYYYDFLLARLLPIWLFWWLTTIIFAGFLKPTEEKNNGIRWVMNIVFVSIVGFAFFIPQIKSISIGFLIEPYPFTATVTEKVASTQKNGTTYRVYLDDSAHKTTRRVYTTLSIGETIEVAQTEYQDMVFLTDQIKLTWVGGILLIINLLSLLGAVAVIGLGYLGKSNNKM